MERLNKSKKSGFKRESGFTLVELSIVLVIIGLIISSVLVGQDLVRSAELRATVTQLEGFNAAVATFKGKYNGLPGDVAGATSFGFAGGDGGGDGLLLAVSGATALSTENVYFWSHLGSTGAALISGAYAGAAVTSTNIAANLPVTKSGNYWGVFAGRTSASGATIENLPAGSESGTNYYVLGVVGDTAAGTYKTAVTITPLEAKNIDDKIDDGKPSVGIVRARGAGADAADTVPSSASDNSACTNYVSTDYLTSVNTNTYSTSATATLCTLRFKMVL